MLSKISGKIFVGMLFVFLHAVAHAHAHANVKCCIYGDSTSCYTASISVSCPESNSNGSPLNSDNTNGSAGDCDAAGGAAGPGGGNSCS